VAPAVLGLAPFLVHGMGFGDGSIHAALSGCFGTYFCLLLFVLAFLSECCICETPVGTKTSIGLRPIAKIRQLR
jgi:hypothetical protein